MREANKDNTRLEHIVQAIGRIKRYTNGKRFDDLVEDDMMYYAVVNYHALQLLAYLYLGMVDCIYIDPPYNKPDSHDWKYNCDYVDGNDSYRHSKWLYMMESRLKIAKKLLNPVDSVLIVTIDELEYHHLGCLLEQMFPEARIQMISTVINTAGVSRGGEFSRSNEFIYFVQIGCSSPISLPLTNFWRGNTKSEKADKLVWNQLMRAGTKLRDRKFTQINFLTAKATKKQKKALVTLINKQKDYLSLFS